MKTTTYGDILNLTAELADRTRDNLPTSEAAMLRALFAAELPDLWNREAWPELCDNLEEVALDENKCFPMEQETLLILSGAGLSDCNGEYSVDGTEGGKPKYVKGANTVSWQLSLFWSITADAGIGNQTVYYSLEDVATPDLVTEWTPGLPDIPDLVSFGISAQPEWSPAPTVELSLEADRGEILAVLNQDPRETTAVSKITEWTPLNNRVHVTTSLSSVWVDWQTPTPDLLDDAVTGGTLADYELPARFKMPLALKGAAHLVRAEDPELAARYVALADAELLKQVARLKLPWWRRN